MIVILI